MTNLKLVNDQVNDSADAMNPILDKTEVYSVIPINLCATQEFVTVPDIATGGKRKRRFGLVLSMSAVPNLDKQAEPLMFPANLATVFLDADSIEDLRERAIYEIDMMIDHLKNAVEEMKKNGKQNKQDKP
mgnify:CR=1 FL=1